MARIRTIKPEFWTDNKIVQLPFEARLLFIGLWNFCDDEGYLEDEPERIRLQVLPSDNVDIDGLLDLLIAAELLAKIVLDDGSTAIHIPHFCEHQKISHPAKSKISPKSSRKLQIPLEVRRKLAIKYGCQPGGEVDVECYTCGQPGRIWWPNNSRGKPGYWVSFSGLEISHFEAEVKGGQSTEENLVLCCQHCNRSMHTKNPVQKVLQTIPEPSRVLQPEGNGKEGKGKEGRGGEGKEEGPPPSPPMVRDLEEVFGEDPDEVAEKLAHLPQSTAEAVDPTRNPVLVKDELIAAWNAMAGPAGLPEAVDIVGHHWSNFRQALRSDAFATRWREMVAMIPSSPFLTGQVPSRDGGPPFRCSLDWLLRDGNWSVVLSGKFHDRKQSTKAKPKTLVEFFS